MTEPLVERMGEAASDFLALLAADQKAKATCALDDDEKRTFWHYTPIARDGLPLTEMDYRQQKAALKLVATGLSRSGYVTASTIMGLETTLDAIEGWSFPPPGRDSRRFYVRIFDSPDAKKPWGWSFEGHHISLNYTIVDGRIVAPTPTFFGAHQILPALLVIAALWLAILVTMLAFRRVSFAATALLAPYFVWVSIATVLNFEIWRLNA